MKHLIYTCLIFTIIACNTEKDKNEWPAIRLNPNYNDNSFLFEDVFTSVETIPLETASNCMFGGVSKLVENNQSLYIMDVKENKILRFNVQGKFLNKIGQAGNGPGEYLKIKDFAIDETNKQIAVYDVRGRKIIIYNFEGEFIRGYNIDPFLHFIKIDKQGNYYGYVGSISNGSYAESNVLKKLKFIKFDNKGNVVGHITGHNNPKIWLDMYEHISYQSDGSITFAEPLQSSLFKLKNDIVTPYYPIDFNNYFVPDNVKEQLDSDDIFESQGKRDFFKEANKNHILGLLNFHENENWIAIQYMINHKYQFAFFHKKSKKLFESSGLPVSHNTMSTLFSPLYIDRTYVYASSSTFYLHKRYNQDKKDKNISDSRIADWETFIDNVDADDNPVIFKYKLNEL